MQYWFDMFSLVEELICHRVQLLIAENSWVVFFCTP